MILSTEVEYRGHMVKYDDLKTHSMLTIKVKCDECGKEFNSTKYQLVRNGHQFCQGCALYLKLSKYPNIGDTFGRLTIIGKSDKRHYVVCKCTCGTIKEISCDNLFYGHTKSCGCLQKDWARENGSNLPHPTGDKHPNWRGGVCTPRQLFEGSRKKRFRKAVFERDGYKCVACGKIENLNSHHIIPFSRDESLADDVNNGITLCSDCHRELHHIYGNNADREKLNNFIKSKRGDK